MIITECAGKGKPEQLERIKQKVHKKLRGNRGTDHGKNWRRTGRNGNNVNTNMYDSLKAKTLKIIN